jgi:hypothetical protein
MCRTIHKVKEEEMSAKRVLLAVLVASIVMLAVGIGPGAQALPPAQEPEPAGATIPYAGRLRDDAGQPVDDGAYDLTFALYDDPAGGELLWSEVQSGVRVQDGAFVTMLGSVNGFPGDVLDGQERWLAVAVRGPGEATFTALAPRQRVSATASTAPASPTADAACPHDHFGEQWIGTGSDGLLIATSNWTGLTAWSDYYIGVAGISTPYSVVWPSGHEYGVFGYSYSDHGVYGQTNGDWSWISGVYGKATKDHANGVTGWNDAGGPGVYAYSQTGSALHASQVGVDLTLLDPPAIYVYTDFGDALYTEVGDPLNWAGKFNGPVWVMGYLQNSSGGFKIDHPLDPENQYLTHSFVESPDMKNMYDGVVVLEADGTAWVELPAWFESLNQDFRYQLTPIGAPGPNLYIAQEIQDNRFQIAGGTPGLKVSWQVTGIRHDPYAEAHPLPVEEDKPAEEQGTYLHPVEYGQPETSGLDSQRGQDPQAGGGP